MLVVAYHIPKWNPILDVSVINNGYLMVDTFFGISGFVIYHSYAGRLTSPLEVLRFQFLRFGRLYAVHLLFFLVFVLLELTIHVAKSQGFGSNGTVPFSHNTPMAALWNVMLIQGMIPGQLPTFNYPSWSISVEFFVYMLFALLILLMRRFVLLAFGTGAAVAVAMLLLHNTFGMDFFVRGVAGFFIGCLIAEALRRHHAFALPQPVGWLIVAAFPAFLSLKPMDEFDIAIYGLTAALIVALLRTNDFIPSKLLRTPVLVWLGTISYSIYMSHAAVIWVTNQVVKLISDLPMIIGPDGGSIQRLSAPAALLASAAIFIVVLTVSALTFRFVERPSREASRRIAWSAPRTAPQAMP